jgi:2-hydroxy-3-keto-5-methylthiopentenyl-1-phosphate phosphatase
VQKYNLSPRWIENSVDYQTYLSQMLEKINRAQNGKEIIQKIDHIKLNYQRSVRIKKSYRINPDLPQVIRQIDKPQQWIVLTEDWCGDSAQNLPFIARMAGLNDKITLRILRRDQNLELMDRYLTSGKRAIPKLIAFDENGAELFNWGPRPEPAIRIFEGLKDRGLEKKEILTQLHQWYARDAGKTLERDFYEILENLHRERSKHKSTPQTLDVI